MKSYNNKSLLNPQQQNQTTQIMISHQSNYIAEINKNIIHQNLESTIIETHIKKKLSGLFFNANNYEYEYDCELLQC